LFGGEGKNLCVKGACTTADIMGQDKGDGLCSAMEVCFCITSHMHLPPLMGAPKCTCFGKPLIPNPDTMDREDPIFNKYKDIFDDTFWVNYCFCTGCGVSGLRGAGRPLFGRSFKQLCIRGYEKCVPPIEDGIWCSSVGTELCLWSQCELPPAPNNPLIACCGWRKNKPSGGGAEKDKVQVVVGKQDEPLK